MNATDVKKYIVWFRDGEHSSHVSIGSKGATLLKLSQAGFPVPEGFCVTTEAFLEFMGCVDACSSIHMNPAITVKELEDAIIASPIPEALDREIIDAYRFIKEQSAHLPEVAVRSSSPMEDQKCLSFAGQYRSLLNIKDEEELRDAIKRCWASIYSPQVAAYQFNRGVTESRPTMALIIQEMVHPEMGGVLFTADPLSAKNDRIVVEVVLGLADEVTSGTSPGKRLIFDRRSLRLLEESGLTWAELGASGPTKINWTPLLAMSLKIEKALEGPQDIEWVLRDGRFLILQSRPITALSGQKTRQTYTRANAGEIMPGVVSPLTWSIFKPVLGEAGRHRATSHLTIHWKWNHPAGTWPESPRLFNGRAYMELATVYTGFAHLPGVSADILRRMLGFEFHLISKDDLPERKPRWHVMDPYRYLRFWLEMAGVTRTLPRQAEEWLSGSSEGVRNRPALSSSSDPNSILADVDRLLHEAARILGLHIQCTSMAFSAFGLVERIVKKYLNEDETQAFQAGMIADFNAITTVQQSIMMWELACRARESKAVSDVLLHNSSGLDPIEHLRTLPEARSFIDLWDQFLESYGDRGIEEFELAVPHWKEDPSFVLSTVCRIIEKDVPDPRIKLEERQRTWRKARQKVDSAIASGPVRRALFFFRRFTDVYTALVPLRENLKYAVVKRFNLMRNHFAVLGKILEERSALHSHSDIFLLHYDEISRLFSDKPVPIEALQETIRQRREAHEEYSKMAVPPIWVCYRGREVPLELPFASDVLRIQGVGSSSGLVTGLAYVLEPGNARDVPPGRIIVAPSIDPGLTPLFVSSIGLVTEIGGVLSHGATVAREFGLPAVVGVPNATTLIQNGREITVDGTTGLVYIRKKEA